MTIARQIVLDTETTGLSPDNGDRIVEIGCVELVNYVPTGKTFHSYVNPHRKMSEGAFRVSGISDEFLEDKPSFEDIYNEFLNFLSLSPVIAHNAQFDIGFLNSELNRIEENKNLSNEVIDTLALAKKKYPGAQASLDALCKRFDIDTSKREKHGALLDAYLLVDVYIELIGGKQTSLSLTRNKREKILSNNNDNNIRYRKFEISDKEKEIHTKMLDEIKNPIWKS